MSMLIMVKAMNTKVGNPLRKLVLIKLADNANDIGECWPSFKHISDQCEISRRSVVMHINDLCAAGLLRKESRKGPKGNSTNLYTITLDGAGAAPGVVQEMHYLVQELHQGGAGAALGGGAGAAPGISHSFESVSESVSEQKTLFAGATVYPLHVSAGKAIEKPARKKSGFDPIPCKPDSVSEKAWGDWCQHRKEIKKPLTEKSVEQQAQLLASCQSPDAVITKSIANGWTGLFPDEPQKPAASSKHHGFDNRDYFEGLTAREDGTYGL